ncbi:MAG TPA: glycosyltransferase family 4 protein [Bacteroidota bacterium]
MNVLAKEFRVTTAIGNGPLQAIRILLGVLQSTVVFCWFASVYAAVATLAAGIVGKRSMIVVGGVDMAKEKEFGYGMWLSPWKSFLVRAAIRNAYRVLVVDESLKAEVLSRAGYQGENIEVLPTGYDPEFWRPSGPKENIVLTVAAVQNEGRSKIKGIDLLFDAAKKLPHVKFELIGLERSMVRDEDVPENCALHPGVEQSGLLQHYQRATIYCQPSRREGLSNSLCEAMLCGCIPVATDVGGSARAVGETGVVVQPGNSDELAAAIERALTLPAQAGSNARERIIGLFPKHVREKRLVDLIRGIIR